MILTWSHLHLVLICVSNVCTEIRLRSDLLSRCCYQLPKKTSKGKEEGEEEEKPETSVEPHCSVLLRLFNCFDFLAGVLNTVRIIERTTSCVSCKQPSRWFGTVTFKYYYPRVHDFNANTNLITKFSFLTQVESRVDEILLWQNVFEALMCKYREHTV